MTFHSKKREIQKVSDLLVHPRITRLAEYIFSKVTVENNFYGFKINDVYLIGNTCNDIRLISSNNANEVMRLIPLKKMPGQ